MLRGISSTRDRAEVVAQTGGGLGIPGAASSEHAFEDREPSAGQAS